MDTQVQDTEGTAPPKTRRAPIDENRTRPDFHPNGARGKILASDSQTDDRLTAPTPSLDPKNITHGIDGYDETTSGYVACALEAFTVAHKNVQAVLDARARVDANHAWTEDAKLIRIAEYASAKQNEATKAFDGAVTRLRSGINSIEEGLSKPLEQQAGLGTVNEEIRRYAQSLDSGARAKFLSEALQAGDAKTIVAVAGAPHYLSGLSKLEHEHLTRRYRELTSPAEVQRLNVMKRGLELCETRGSLVLGQIEGALGGRGAWQRVQQARERNRAAEAALSL